MFKFRLHPLFEMDGDIGAASVSVETTSEDVSTGTAPAQEAAELTPESKDSETSFAKRLREHSDKEVKAAREAWEKETGEKYKDYEVLKKTSEYFAKINGVSDVMTLSERIEMEQLQEAAEKQQVPVEVLQRIQQLEAKASKGDELEAKIQQQEQERTYWEGVNKFAESKGIDGKALNQYMIDNQMMYDPDNMDKSLEIAFKAMDYDNVKQAEAEAEKAGMKKLLQAKGSIPNVGGNKQAAQVTQGPPKTWAEARQRAMNRDYNPI